VPGSLHISAGLAGWCDGGYVVMEYARLGGTELAVSRLGYGCAAMGGYDYGRVSDEESVRGVQLALALGINLFDTADVYGFGHAEQVLGSALGPRKNDVIIATKFGVRWDSRGRTVRDTSASWVGQAVEGSLRRLGVDCIPVCQIHWPDDRTPIAETLEALRRLQVAGKVRYVGCCNFDAKGFDEVQMHGRVESLQLPYSLVERQWEETIRHCFQRHRVAVLSYSPLAQGLLTGKYGAASRFEGTDLRKRSPLFRGETVQSNLATVERLKVVGARHKRTAGQVAIRWILDNSSVTCAVAGIKTPEQVEENAGALEWTLSEEDRGFLVGASLTAFGGTGEMPGVVGE